MDSAPSQSRQPVPCPFPAHPRLIVYGLICGRRWLRGKDVLGGPDQALFHSEHFTMPVAIQFAPTVEVLTGVQMREMRLRASKPQDHGISERCIEQGFEVVRDRLAKHGIEVRLKKRGPRMFDRGDPLYSDPSDSKSESGEENFLRVKDVSLKKFMQMLDRWAVAGWILYPDGSITYFDSQCACSWPKNGIYCHDSQYEEGKPEVMKAASEKQQAQVQERSATE